MDSSQDRTKELGNPVSGSIMKHIFQWPEGYVAIFPEILRSPDSTSSTKYTETEYKIACLRDSATKINGHKCHDSEIGAK